ncbi:MAG: hypothetical protein GY805_01240 [Chloroflexi bacterium]|nr:hypothetical protein [Chloroflexota bacterium]
MSIDKAVRTAYLSLLLPLHAVKRTLHNLFYGCILAQPIIVTAVSPSTINDFGLTIETAVHTSNFTSYNCYGRSHIHHPLHANRDTFHTCFSLLPSFLTNERYKADGCEGVFAKTAVCFAPHQF